jgi:hypothetical protein
MTLLVYGPSQVLVGTIADGWYLVVGRDMFADAASQVATTASQAAENAKSTDINIDEAANTDREAVKEKSIAVSESARKATTQVRDELESYFREKFPKQRRDAVINHMKKAVQEIQENPEFQETMDFIVDMMCKYATRVKDSVVGEGKKADVQPDENFDIAMKDVQVRQRRVLDRITSNQILGSPHGFCRR